ncbi:unnamed protein product, partial [Timema podura]|nr:unnamed protein product [Timema podura]
AGFEAVNPEVLELHNVTYEDEGWYTCVAGNGLGIAYASAYLRVVEDLDPVITLKTGSPPSIMVYILSGVLCSMFLVGLVIVISIFKKLKRLVEFSSSRLFESYLSNS